MSRAIEINTVEPRELGSLHARASYLIALITSTVGTEWYHHAISNAAWDLVDMLGRVPDVAYENHGSGPLLPIEKCQKPKLGLEKSKRDIQHEARTGHKPFRA